MAGGGPFVGAGIAAATYKIVSESGDETAQEVAKEDGFETSPEV